LPERESIATKHDGVAPAEDTLSAPPSFSAQRPESVTEGTLSQDGRRETLQRVLRERIDGLFRYILVRVGRDQHAAEDVLQQTAFVALRHERVPRTADEQERWLRGIAKNIVRRHWRDNGRARTHGFIGDAARARCLLGEIDADRCPVDELTRTDTMDQLLCAIASLGAHDQQLLYAFYKRQRSQVQIAEELGISAKGVETRLYRMRAKLRDALRELDGSVT